jgi:hypothetical protein
MIVWEQTSLEKKDSIVDAADVDERISAECLGPRSVKVDVPSNSNKFQSTKSAAVRKPVTPSVSMKPVTLPAPIGRHGRARAKRLRKSLLTKLFPTEPSHKTMLFPGNHPLSYFKLEL